MYKKQIRILILSIALFLGLLVSGCATRSEIRKFQQQSEYLIETQAEQQRQLAMLDSMMLELHQLLRQVNANQQYNLEIIQSEIRIVENILSESGYQVSALTQRIESIQQEMVTTQPQVADSADTVVQEQQATINPKQLIETAHLDFNRGKFELAKMEFEQFLENFPNSALADDAQYSLAECLYALGKYDEAKIAFLKIKSDYSESDLVAPALYKAGMSALKVDDILAARTLFQELIDNYPNSHEAPPAREKLKMLGQ